MKYKFVLFQFILRTHDYFQLEIIVSGSQIICLSLLGLGIQAYWGLQTYHLC